MPHAPSDQRAAAPRRSVTPPKLAPRPKRPDPAMRAAPRLHPHGLQPMLRIDLSSLMAAAAADTTAAKTPEDFRRLVADSCRRLLTIRTPQLPSAPINQGDSPPSASKQPSNLAVANTPPPQTENLSRRLLQTLAALLQGCSEKQVAFQLGLSRHTVHIYVKSLYRHFNVSSRGELLARFVTQKA